MSVSIRRRIALSPFRRNIIEMMRLSRQIPLVTAERRMSLGALVHARQECAIKPSWSVLFCKAYSLVAVRRPELRRTYVTFPYAHIYEHPNSYATVMVEREYRGEVFPLNYRLRRPEETTLLDLHRKLEGYRTGPIDDDETFQRMHRVGSYPYLLRRLSWWMGYHWSGCKRARYFGTFALSSPAARGAGLTTILSPLASTLHYGLFSEAGEIDMRLTFDHRVNDGAPIARALSEMEDVLRTELLDELKSMRSNISADAQRALSSEAA